MKIFVAGATGVIGRPLVARMVCCGHEVTAISRSPERAAALRERGVPAVVCDAYDVDGVYRAIAEARPEVVVDLICGTPQHVDRHRYAESVTDANRLRRETTPTFVRAAGEAGAARIVLGSVVSIERWRAPADAAPPADAEARAIAAAEAAVAEADGIEGVVLRFGRLYGPGSALAPGGAIAERIRRRRLPVVGDGADQDFFVHVDDAVEATLLALDRADPGTYDVCDDEPAPARDWIPAAAAAMGAGRPLRTPRWLGALTGGVRRSAPADDRRPAGAVAREALGWRPAFASYREGFAAVFGDRERTRTRPGVPAPRPAEARRPG